MSGIITQGRSDADEWVESFTVRYSQDGKSWSTLQEPDGSDKVRDTYVCVCWGEGVLLDVLVLPNHVYRNVLKFILLRMGLELIIGN